MGKCERAIRFLASYANRTKAVREEIEGMESSIQFDIDGEEPFYIVIADGMLKFSRGRSEHPDATIKAKSDIFFQVITQQVDAEESFTHGKYHIDGSMVDAIRFRRIGNLTMESHRVLFKLLLMFGRLL